MEERMIEYIKSLTEKERLSLCRKQISIVIRDFARKENAVNAEFNFNSLGMSKRTARNRGGKATTLTANAVNNTQMYFKSIEDLKLIIKYL